MKHFGCYIGFTKPSEELVNELHECLNIDGMLIMSPSAVASDPQILNLFDGSICYSHLVIKFIPDKFESIIDNNLFNRSLSSIQSAISWMKLLLSKKYNQQNLDNILFVFPPDLDKLNLLAHGALIALGKTLSVEYPKLKINTFRVAKETSIYDLKHHLKFILSQSGRWITGNEFLLNNMEDNKISK